MIKNYVSQLKSEFQNYTGADCMKDLMAGLTVAAVALPLGLAFGVSSGSTAAAGLVTAIIAGLVIGALSGGYYQISGPTGAMAAILISIIARYGMQGVFTATLIAGILLVLCGIFHIGRLTSFIPAPVITGFTSGIAVIITGTDRQLLWSYLRGLQRCRKTLKLWTSGLPCQYTGGGPGTLRCPVHGFLS